MDPSDDPLFSDEPALDLLKLQERAHQLAVRVSEELATAHEKLAACQLTRARWIADPDQRSQMDLNLMHSKVLVAEARVNKLMAKNYRMGAILHDQAGPSAPWWYARAAAASMARMIEQIENDLPCACHNPAHQWGGATSCQWCGRSAPGRSFEEIFRQEGRGHSYPLRLVFKHKGQKYVASQPDQVKDLFDEFIGWAHEDQDFSYVCGAQHCKCIQ